MRDHCVEPEVQDKFTCSEPSPCAALIRVWATIGINHAKFKAVVGDLVLIHGPARDFNAKMLGLHGYLHLATFGGTAPLKPLSSCTSDVKVAFVTRTVTQR